MNKLFSNRQNEKGQGLVEYAIIIALVAVVVVASMKFLGPKISCTFETVNNSLPGEAAASSANCGTASAASESQPAAAEPTSAPAQPTGICYLRWTGTQWVHWYDNTPEVPGVCP